MATTSKGPLTMTSVIFLLLWAPVGAANSATVFQASDPVGPGQTIVLVGESFAESTRAEVARLPDAEPGEPPATDDSARWLKDLKPLPAETPQAGPQCVKFVVPASLPLGLYAWRIRQPDGSEAVGLVNRPVIWWAQGDAGLAASPGGWLRCFGKNLASPAVAQAAHREGASEPAAPPSPSAFVFLHGPRNLRLPGRGSCWDLQVTLPSDLPEGDYAFQTHNGFGGAAGWSAPAKLRVARPQPWPQQVFDVTRADADPTGQRDSTAAIEAVLAKAGEQGGGVVYFPRGRYRLSAGLKVPQHTVLRGQRSELVCLAWSDMELVPEALVQGTNSFGLEDLTLYANRYQHVIVGDQGGTPDAGDVFLRRVCVRASLYRGHPTPEEVDQRFRESLKWSTGGGDTVRLGGRNIEITDCDLYGAGRVLFLSRTRGGRLTGNRLSNGRWGWYCISGTDGLIFENNRLTGGDLMSTGGGLNCLDGSNYSQNIFFARNRMGLAHGWDREIMTTDAGGEAYRGLIQAAEGTQLTLADDPLPQAKNRDWQGAGVFILAGRGAGQWRRAVRVAGRTVDVDRPWAVPPDEQSHVSISMFQGRYLVVDNQFFDCGAVQFYGTSIDCVLAGNSGARMAGFAGLGLDYHGLQPSWYCLFLNNRLTEGNYYHWNEAVEATLQIRGNPGPRFAGPINCGAVVRGNRLENNSHLDVRGAVRDAVVEDNAVESADLGIFVSQSCRGVLVRNNRFRDVKSEVVDEPTLRRVAAERMRRFLGRQEPIAVWSCDKLEGRRLADSSGNGFHALATAKGVSVVPGRRGSAVRLDGSGWLRVEEPAVFNAPELTICLWVKPDKLSGRYGLVAKRFGGSAAPWVVSQSGDRVGFEATDEDGGVWSFNFQSPGVLKTDAWTHLAVVVKQGSGIVLYANGQEVARKAHAGVRCNNSEPLVIGREAWGGDPPNGSQPGIFAGLLDELHIWTRALSPEEIQADLAAAEQAPGP